MGRSSEGPDPILLDKINELDPNQSEDHSFFLALKKYNNINTKLQERARMGGRLKMPM
jgi:hypothetical protein